MEILKEKTGGKPSFMRWLAAGSALVGTGMIVAGLIGWFKGMDGATTIIGTGSGLILSGGIEKVIQKKFEVGG
jgi:hypothetical protein